MQEQVKKLLLLTAPATDFSPAAAAWGFDADAVAGF